MTAAREAVLASIRAALAEDQGVNGNRMTPTPRRYRATSDLTPLERRRLFVERVSDYGADVVESSAAGTVAAIAAFCWAHGVEVLAVSGSLDPRLVPANVVLRRAEELSIAELDTVDGALTTCALAVAESGTVILDGREGQGPRSLTLIPDLHICVVREDQIVGLLPEAFARMDSDRAFTLVSGPSATSDIELTRICGVHGPRRLAIFVASDEEWEE